jgi:hypothetical protein
LTDACFQSCRDLLVWQAGMNLAEECYLQPDKLEPLLGRAAEIGKMLRSLIRSLQEKAALT